VLAPYRQYRPDGGGWKNQRRCYCIIDHRNSSKSAITRPVRHCQNYATTLLFPKPEVLFSSRWKSNRVLFVFGHLLFHVINLGGFHSGTIVRQVQFPLYCTVLYYVCLHCLLLALLATVSSWYVGEESWCGGEESWCGGEESWCGGEE
jgi:hypothetical protein